MKKIGFITTTRADFDLLAPVIRLSQDSADIATQLYVTGMHLDQTYGHTIDSIIAQGFKVTASVNINVKGHSPSDIAASAALAQTGFLEAFEKNRPDLIVVLGDRFELMPIMLAATLLNIPVAHVHGGEKTLGAIDESIRHSVTKFSHLHFTSCETHKKRVIQLGEHPSRVFDVGSLGVENITKLTLLSKDEIKTRLNLTLPSKFVVATLHPETSKGLNYQLEMVDNFLWSLDQLPDLYVIFTHNNSDTFADSIQNKINEYVERNPAKSILFKSLGQHNYYSIVKLSNGVVGNSSSGIIEVPSFHVGTLDVGDRQKGRLSSKTVIHSEITREALLGNLKRLLSDTFLQECKTYKNPYDKNGTAQSIFLEIKKADLGKIGAKDFYDISFQ